DSNIARNVEAVVGAPASHVGCISAGDHRFGRRASGIDTSAAKKFTLDKRYLHSRSCQAICEWRPCLSSADNDRVKFVRHAKHPPRVRAEHPWHLRDEQKRNGVRLLPF